MTPALLAGLAIGFPTGWLIVRCAQRVSERHQREMRRRLLAERIQARTEASPQMQVQAEGHLYLFCTFCTQCGQVAHTWPYGATVTVPQIILAEQRHLTAMHPLPEPDYDALHDGYYGTGCE